jgi:hypothetical protein
LKICKANSCYMYFFWYVYRFNLLYRAAPTVPLLQFLQEDRNWWFDSQNPDEQLGRSDGIKDYILGARGDITPSGGGGVGGVDRGAQLQKNSSGADAKDNVSVTSDRSKDHIPLGAGTWVGLEHFFGSAQQSIRVTMVGD